MPCYKHFWSCHDTGVCCSTDEKWKIRESHLSLEFQTEASASEIIHSLMENIIERTKPAAVRRTICDSCPTSCKCLYYKHRVWLKVQNFVVAYLQKLLLIKLFFEWCQRSSSLMAYLNCVNNRFKSGFTQNQFFQSLLYTFWVRKTFPSYKFSVFSFMKLYLSRKERKLYEVALHCFWQNLIRLQ